MTDYSGHARGVKRKVGAVGGTTVVIFLIGVILSLVAVRGIVGNKKNADVRVNRWDGVSSFVLAIDGSKDYLAILQKDPKRVVLFALGDAFAGGANPEEMIKSISEESGVLVGNYLVSSGGDDVLASFGNFTSYLTPIKIALGGWDNVNNNIARTDAIALWWQAKNIRVNDVLQIDIQKQATPDKDQSVLGVNTADVNRVITPYVENLAILNDDLEINIVNATEDPIAPTLMKKFITSVGGRVTTVSGTVDFVEKCYLVGKDSYIREYLAKTFDCDIKDQVFGEPDDILNIVIGQDFVTNHL